MTYACDEEKTMLEIASEMDGKPEFETTAEMDCKRTLEQLRRCMSNRVLNSLK